MRNRMVAMSAAVAVFALGCGRLFNITIDDEVVTTVERGTVLEEFTGSLGFDELTAINVFDAQELQNQGVEPGDVEEVVLTQFDLEATAPEGADLSFLQELKLFVEAPGLDRLELASRSDFPEGQAYVELDLSGADISEYVVSESMTLTTDITANRPEEDIDVTAYWALRVGVTGQGACNQARQGD